MVLCVVQKGCAVWTTRKVCQMFPLLTAFLHEGCIGSICLFYTLGSSASGRSQGVYVLCDKVVLQHLSCEEML